MSKTPWFPADAKPVRAGVYDTRIAVDSWKRERNALGGALLVRVSSIEVRLYWNGRVWLASSKSLPYTAGLFRQQREWRGVFSHAKARRPQDDEVFDGEDQDAP
jgi:hypothetical protein